MYSKEHKREIKTLFYTSFGKYMSKNNASTGKIKWLNYPTQVKDIYFRIFPFYQLKHPKIELMVFQPSFSLLYLTQHLFPNVLDIDFLFQ